MSGQPTPSPVPAQIPYGGSPFVVTTGAETIPSNFPVVLLKVNTPSLTMHGTPVIANGTTVGQRLLIVLAEPSEAVGFTNGGIGSTFQVFGTWGLEATAYGGMPNYPAAQSAMELVWVGDAWQLVGFPTATGIQVEAATPNLHTDGHFALAGDTAITDPNPATTMTVTAVVQAIDLTAADTVMTAVPTIDTSPAFDGEFVMIYMVPDAGFRLTLQDESVLGGSGLRLKTPTVVLMANDFLMLRWSNIQSVWIEVCRASRGEAAGAGNTSGQAVNTGDSLAIGLVRTLVVTLPGGNASLGTPNVALGNADGQEVLVVVDPAAGANMTILDENTTPGAGVRLSATSHVLTPGSSVRLRYNAGNTTWYETGVTILV